MQTRLPFLVMIVILVVIAVIVNNLLRYRLQKRVIESGLLDADSLKTLLQPTGLVRDALKWGLILLFGGIGLVVLEFVPYRAVDSPLPYGVEAIFLAVGYLTYYGLVRKQT